MDRRTDGRTYGHTYWQTDISPSNVIRLTLGRVDLTSVFWQQTNVHWLSTAGAQSTVFNTQHCVPVIEQPMASSWLRFNVDNTELISTGTKYNVSLSVILWQSVVPLSSQHIPSAFLESCWHQTCRSTRTSLQSVLSPSFSYDNFVAYDILLTVTQPLVSSTRLLLARLTTVAVFRTVLQRSRATRHWEHDAGLTQYRRS